MRKIILILLLLPLCAVANPNQDLRLDNKINNIKLELKGLEEELNRLNEQLLFQQRLSEQVINTVSVQLNASTRSLNLAVILFAIFVVFLGAYVTIMARRIENSKKDADQTKHDVERMLNVVSQTRRVVKKTSDDINNNITKIYQQIKREETISLLDRLVDIPEDVINIFKLLVSRELQSCDFTKLKQAYLKLKTISFGKEYEKTLEDEKHNYQILLFQHFFVLSIKDVEIRQDINIIISDGIHCAFGNDLEKSTEEFVELLTQEGVKKFKNELNEYFKAFLACSLKEHKEIYKMFFENLKERRLRFELFDTINSDKTTRVAKMEYGRLLAEQYANVDNLNETEKRVLNELKHIEEELEKESTPL
ncbi:MAG: hypothetical protein FWC10_08475 [Lentimicrobiaceae bacterium]|nr:hypothetical protein [Lentimicrobiaceae bacterium]